MSNYTEIDTWVLRYKKGQQSPRGSQERENSKAAGELLVMAFKPLILSTISRCGVPGNQMEDAFQDGCLAFLQGLNRFDTACGSGFNAFIKTHLHQYFRKRQTGRFNCSVKGGPSLDMPAGEGLTLLEAMVDEGSDIEKNYLAGETRKSQRTWLRRGLARLSLKQRAVVQAHYRQGLSLREIAKMQGIAHQSVSGTHDRALSRMRAAIKEPL